MTIPWSYRPGFLNPVSFRVENKFEKKKMKKLGLWDCGMVTGGPGLENEFEKNEKTRSVRPWYGDWRTA